MKKMDIRDKLKERQADREKARAASSRQHETEPFDIPDDFLTDDEEWFASEEEDPETEDPDQETDMEEDAGCGIPDDAESPADEPTEQTAEAVRGAGFEIRSRHRRYGPADETSKKEILIGIVLDGTLSFAKVYPKVYYMLSGFLQRLGRAGDEYKGVVIRYGLIVLHDVPEEIRFSGGEAFTESEKDFLDMLRRIDFYGGSADGREDLKGALDLALRLLNTSGSESSYRGLLFFSDSLPPQEDLGPDFYASDQNGYRNYGLRFADFYTYTGDFTPQIRIVDRYNQVVQNGRNEATYGSIEELIDGDMDRILEKAEQMMRTILNQASVN